MELAAARCWMARPMEGRKVAASELARYVWQAQLQDILHRFLSVCQRVDIRIAAKNTEVRSIAAFGVETGDCRSSPFLVVPFLLSRFFLARQGYTDVKVGRIIVGKL